MKTVLVTGANGFVGKNLMQRLKKQEGINVLAFDIEDDPDVLEERVLSADLIFHLAGVNRPKIDDEFETGNAGLTQTIVDILTKANKKTGIVFSSSVQAALNNPYGRSKKKAEEALAGYGRKRGADLFLYRFPNIFGKWCRPNYNSVVATFCHNISHGQSIVISDESREIELIYVDDVVDEFFAILDGKRTCQKDFSCRLPETFKLTLGELAQKIYELKDMRQNLIVPDMSDRFMRCLQATYLSHLDIKDFSYTLNARTDERGSLTELIKSKQFGQIFVSTSGKGVMRGNHYHHTKVEKFCVLTGEAVIQFRHILSDEVVSYSVSGKSLEVVDIPPGYTHSIENTGDSEIVVLFWANQIFDPNEPDTYFCEVR